MTMKIAIAGTNGLAQFIAHYLSLATSHNFVFLSRQANPGLTKGHEWQVLVVSYRDMASLTYTLKGLDLVISTLTSEAQLALIEAAAQAQVRHFIPSGFSGPLQCKTQLTGNEQWRQTISLLEEYNLTSGMHYTVFTCGVFYERFGPGGLNAVQISTFRQQNGVVGEEGNFLVDVRTGKATVIVSGIDELAICLTSVRDAARYVVSALQAFEDMGVWPKEYKFFTERLTMSELRGICERVRGAPIVPNFTTPAALIHAFEDASHSNDHKEALAISQHIAVASKSAINFPTSEVNLFSSVLASAGTPGVEHGPSEPFETWLSRAWSIPHPSASNVRASANTSGQRSMSSRSGSSQKSKRPTPQ